MFKQLKDYYNYIENDDRLSVDLNLSKQLIALRDNYNQTAYKKKCSFELFYNDFRFEKGKLKPELTYSDGRQYPNVELFDDDFEYIISRAEKTTNPKHKAQYNHLIWESKFKHNKYCKNAISNYLLFLKKIKTSEKNNIENKRIAIIYENLFILSQTINYKKTDTIDFFIFNLIL